MTWVAWIIGLALLVGGVPALGALGVGALALTVRLLTGAMGRVSTDDTP